MARKRNRVPTDGPSGPLGANPFGALDAAGLPEAPEPGAARREDPSRPPGASGGKRRGRLDIIRERAGRGGKTVTVIRGFKGISREEKAALAKTIQKRCGVGGAVKDGRIEIQGDRRAEAQAVLEAAGFSPVLAGG